MEVRVGGICYFAVIYVNGICNVAYMMVAKKLKRYELFTKFIGQSLDLQ